MESNVEVITEIYGVSEEEANRLLAEEREKRLRRVARLGGVFREPTLEEFLPGYVRKVKRHLNPISNPSQSKVGERAKRFSIPFLSPENVMTPPNSFDEKAFYTFPQPPEVNYISSNEIHLPEDPAEERYDVAVSEDNQRSEAIHLYGTDELTTSDVFRYFESYTPTSIEWLNDSSCNVVFKDAAGSELALMELSRPFDPSTLAPNSPLSHWRRSSQEFKGHHLLMRHATHFDVRQTSTKKRGRYERENGKERSGKRRKQFDRSERTVYIGPGKGRDSPEETMPASNESITNAMDINQGDSEMVMEEDYDYEMGDAPIMVGSMD